MRSDNPTDLTHIVVTALLDTGASCSAISPRVVEQLGLGSYEKRRLVVATEERLVEYFFFRVGIFPDADQVSQSGTALPHVFAELDGFGMRSSPQFDVILGMDVLSQCDLRIARNGNWTLQFGT